MKQQRSEHREEADSLPSHPLAYSVDQFAVAINSSRAQVYNRIREGRLRARKDGSRTIITRDDGLAYLAGLPDMASNGSEAA